MVTLVSYWTFCWIKPWEWTMNCVKTALVECATARNGYKVCEGAVIGDTFSSNWTLNSEELSIQDGLLDMFALAFFGTLRIMEFFRMALDNQGILFWNFDGIPELSRAILRWLWWLKTGRSPLELFSTMWMGPFIFQVSPLGDISMIPFYGIWGYMLHVEQMSYVITNCGTSIIHPIQLSFAVIEVLCLCKKLFVMLQWCVREDNDFIV